MSARVVIGLGFGDEGKGTVVDHLVRTTDADCVVRFNGGAQAGHNVLVPSRHPLGSPYRDGDGYTRHEFRQFGSGFFAGAHTHLSRYCVVNPDMLVHEARSLADKAMADPWARISVASDAAVTTPFHVAANRVREVARGAHRHGSCGLGIWETEADRRRGEGVTFRDIVELSHEGLRIALAQIQERKCRELASEIAGLPGSGANVHAHPLHDTLLPALLAGFYKDLVEVVPVFDGAPPGCDSYVFEGAQGVLLDESLGFHPYTTGSTTTAANAIGLCHEWGLEFPHITGVTRSYATRHGAGPFPTEDPSVRFPEPHNLDGAWQRAFRQGHLDLVLLDYAVRAESDVRDIAITHMDRAQGPWRVAVDYASGDVPLPCNRSEQEAVTGIVSGAVPFYEVVHADDLPGVVAESADRPVALLSYGPTAHEKAEAMVAS